MQVPLLSTTFSSLPVRQHEWVSYTGMLTKKLGDLYDNVHMTVLSHAWVATNWWERWVLQFQASEKVMRRDIIMRRSEKTCWFARTMIPLKTYELNPSFFDRLNNEPLGHLIFNEPRVVRLQMHSYMMNDRHAEFYWVNEAWRARVSELSVRKSLLQFEGKGMFCLLEIFLPGLM